MPKVTSNMFKILSDVSLYYAAKEKNGHKQDKKKQTALESNAHSAGTLMTENLTQHLKFLFKEIIDRVE